MKNTISKRFAYAILSLILVTCIAFSFTACSNNNEENYTPPNQISVLQVFERNKTDILAGITDFAKEKIEGIPSVLYGGNVVTLSKTAENDVFTYTVKSSDSLCSYVVKVPAVVVGVTSDGSAISTIISKAGYTADQKINDTTFAVTEVVNNLKTATDTVRAEIEKLDSKENINVVMHNDYLKFVEQNGNIFTGAVREDGSILKFEVTSAGDIFETLVKKDGTSLTRSISATEKYEAPAIEQIKYVTVQDLLDQYFVGFEAYDFVKKAEEIAFFEGRERKLVIYSSTENGIKFYLNETSNGRESLIEFVYQGSVGKDLMELDKYKTVDDIYSALGLTAQHEVEEGSQAYLELVNKIETLKQQLDTSKQNVDNLTKSDFQSTRMLMNTDSQLPAEANKFGEKLAPEGSEVLMTYVGDISGKHIDSDSSLGTGSYSRYDVLVVYSDGNNHYIKKVSIDVPWYANSTKESLYNHIFTSENYEIAKEENTTVSDAVVVAPKQQNAETFEAINLNLFAEEMELGR